MYPVPPVTRIQSLIRTSGYAFPRPRQSSALRASAPIRAASEPGTTPALHPARWRPYRRFRSCDSRSIPAETPTQRRRLQAQPRCRAGGHGGRRSFRTRTTGFRKPQSAQACPYPHSGPLPPGSATGRRSRRPSPNPATARSAGSDRKLASIAWNPVERIVPHCFADRDLSPRHHERLRAELRDLDRHLERALIDGLRFSLDPFLQPRPHGRFPAQFHARLRHRGQRFFSCPESGQHHRRRPPRHRIVLPGPGVGVAARPDINAVAVSLVARESALVAVAGERRARAPRIAAHAVLGVVQKISVVAVAPGPGFHAAALLLAFMELADLAGASLCGALSLRLPVLAAAGVGSLQLRIKHKAFGLSLRSGGQRAEHKRKDAADEVKSAVSNHPGGLWPPPLLKKGGEVLRLKRGEVLQPHFPLLDEEGWLRSSRGGHRRRHYFVSHVSVTPAGLIPTLGPLSSGLRLCSQKKSPIANPRKELATVSDSQCSREAILPAFVSAANPYSQGASYSRANGVTAAHMTVAWVEGKDASERLKGSKSPEPCSSTGRARPTAYLIPRFASRPVAPACTAAIPVLLRRLSCSESAASPAPNIAAIGKLLPTKSAVSIAPEPA